MENLVVGLIRGRHDMPCDKYIFDSGVKDIFKLRGMYLPFSFFRPISSKE
jgi:hypothetical protein